MAERPLVTVVIPTWNRLPLLRQAVDSVRAQSWAEWELVIADDGSTDGTAEWVRALGDPRVRLVSAPHSGNPGQVRNRGVAAGWGALVAFLDSDDAWLPAKLELQVGAMLRQGARWCYGGYELTDAGGNAMPSRTVPFAPLTGRIVREILTGEANVSIVTVVAERSLLDEVGGFSEDPRAGREDRELELRLALRADAAAVGEVVARVREHPGRSTAALADPFERSAAVYDCFLELDPPAELARVARRMRARQLADAGAHRLAGGEYAAAARLFARSLPHAPAAGWLRALARGARGRLRGR
ncbi:MAG TPA: glycosyltransferase family 2 protein [Longimicrobium sp.]